MGCNFKFKYTNDSKFREEIHKTYYGKPINDMDSKTRKAFTGEECREYTLDMIGEMMAFTQYRLFRNTEWYLINDWHLFIRSDIRNLIKQGYLILSAKEYKPQRLQYYHPNEWFYKHYIEPKFKKIVDECEGIAKVKKIIL